MKNEIITPTSENEFIRDPDLENKILGLVTNENWGQVADLFLQIPMKNYCELNKFMLKLFEIVRFVVAVTEVPHSCIEHL